MARCSRCASPEEGAEGRGRSESSALQRSARPQDCPPCGGAGQRTILRTLRLARVSSCLCSDLPWARRRSGALRWAPSKRHRSTTCPRTRVTSARRADGLAGAGLGAAQPCSRIAGAHRGAAGIAAAERMTDTGLALFTGARTFRGSLAGRELAGKPLHPLPGGVLPAQRAQCDLASGRSDSRASMRVVRDGWRDCVRNGGRIANGRCETVWPAAHAVDV
jgi:hypothetical protein